MPRLLDSSRSARSSQVNPGFQTGSEAHAFRSSAPANRRRSVSTPRIEEAPGVIVLKPVVRRRRAAQPTPVVPATTALTVSVSQKAGCCTGSGCTSTGVAATTVSTSAHSRRCELPELTRRIGIAACAVHHASPLANTNSCSFSSGRKTGKCPCRRLLGLERFDLDAETRRKEHEKEQARRRRLETLTQNLLPILNISY
jgi:hypothetical protein